MSHREATTAPVNTAGLSSRMIDALSRANARFDGAIEADRRTWGALYHRGLVEVLRGRGTNRYGETTYNVITGVYLTDAGRAVVAA